MSSFTLTLKWDSMLLKAISILLFTSAFGIYYLLSSWFQPIKWIFSLIMLKITVEFVISSVRMLTKICVDFVDVISGYYAFLVYGESYEGVFISYQDNQNQKFKVEKIKAIEH